MSDGRRENRWRQWLVWCGVAMLALGPPGYLGVLWTRHQWAIQQLTASDQIVTELAVSSVTRLERHNVYSVTSLSSIRNRFEFASDTRFTEQVSDLLAPTPQRSSFSLFPPLYVQIEAPELSEESTDRAAILKQFVAQAIQVTSRLHALQSLDITSPRIGPLLDQSWGIRELSVQNQQLLSSPEDTWDNLDLEKLDRSMPRLHLLSLFAIHWNKPVNFPEQGFSNLVTLAIEQVTTSRWQLFKRRGLRYVRVDGEIAELIVSDCPDLERLDVDSIRKPRSIAIQHLPRLKALSVQHTSSLKINCVLSDLPALETVFLKGHFRATHLQGLAEMPNLKRVGLDVWKLDDAMVDQLLKIKSMEELHLSIGAERANLAKLATHPSLKTLQIHVHRREDLDESNRDRIEESELKALTANGRIRVEVLETLEEAEVESSDEDDTQPMQNNIPMALPGGVSPGGASPGGVSPGPPAANAP